MSELPVFIAEEPGLEVRDDHVYVIADRTFVWPVNLYRRFLDRSRTALLEYEARERNVLRLRPRRG